VTPTFQAVSTATATASVAPTVAQSCPGDCDQSGAVTVDEIVSGVNMALGVVPVDVCGAMDMDHSASVTVDELLRAIDSALNGCG